MNLMNRSFKKNIFVLVEGAKTDVVVMRKLFNIYEISDEYEIVSYCTNIYTLYQQMFRDSDGNLEDMDILQVLKSRVTKNKLLNYITYIT